MKRRSPSASWIASRVDGTWLAEAGIWAPAFEHSWVT